MRTLALIGELLDVIVFGIMFNKWAWIIGGAAYLIYRSRNG